MIQKQHIINSNQQPVSEERDLFGDLEVSEDNVLEFHYGLPGFESLTKFVIVDLEDYPPFRTLQSLEEPDVSMLILDARLLIVHDSIKIPFRELMKIGIDPDRMGIDSEVYVILKINKKTHRFTANLKAPLLINTKKRIGYQVILDDENLAVNYSLNND